MSFFAPFAFIQTPVVLAAGFDPDAEAFITATGISGSNATAINTLVLDLKGYGIWSSFSALYPFIGGTYDTCKYNLVSPLNTNAAFRLTTSGSVTFNSNGITGNGSDGVMQTFYVPSTNATLNNFHMSVYSRTNVLQSSTDIGAYSNPGGDTLIQSRHLISGQERFNVNCNLNYFNGAANTDSRGHFMLNRDPANTADTQGYKNGSLVVSGAQAHQRPTLNLVICATVAPGAVLFSTRNYALASIGLGFDATQASNYYTAVQAYQTTLGRQV